MPLVIVESPNKCKKLKSILGNGYVVMASVGHIMDLDKKNMGINTETWDVTYKPNRDKRDVISGLKAEAKNHDAIYIATDGDFEGHAIAFNIRDILPKRGKKYYRSVFPTITKKDVLNGIKNPITFDENALAAQQTRRITDRLVGFRVSPVMWNKGLRGTSAGRVQSVALKIISEREKEIKAFVPREYWEITVDTNNNFSADFFGINGKQIELSGKKEAHDIIDDMNKNKLDLKVYEYDAKKRIRKPSPPFITSTMQQAASNFIGWGAKKTMSVAQSLFSQGLITYHRSDSIRTDPGKVKELRDKVKKDFGSKYLSKTTIVYSAKGGSQDAHEAIRPTYEAPISSLSGDEKKLLKLISNKFMASQMASAEFNQVAAKFQYNGKSTYNFKKNGSTLAFDGFLKVYGSIKDDVILPVMKIGDMISWDKIESSQHFTSPPPRYSDASIIKTLEKEGVGRPSTYAAIIDTLLNRKYVDRKKKSLCATEIGIMVSDYLSEFFKTIVDTKFTAEMESRIDKIAEGSLTLSGALDPFYKSLEGQIQFATKGNLPDTFIADQKCLKCKKDMIKKISKHGAFLGCVGWPECNGTASLGNDSAPENVETGHSCPTCSNILIKRKSKRGEFYGCSSYPDCKFAANIDKDGGLIIKEGPKDTGLKCPKCNKNNIVERISKRGKFYGCSGFPKCKTIVDIDDDGKIVAASEKSKSADKKTGEKCPKCSSGDLVIKNGKFGKFKGCSEYKSGCKYIGKVN
jgi:DNA topoisomerase-1